MEAIVRILACVCLVLLGNVHLSAQSYNFKIDGLCSKNYVQTPEMSAIKQIALSSVNYSTGTIDIRIPLFDIECGDLTLPIYLSYNSTGIKVNEPCSWVGQNWSLHAEPILTRIPKGHIDTGGKCDFAFYKDDTSYDWVKKYLDNNIFSTVDNMPDEYNFSLLSGGGMFMYCTDKDNKDRYVCLPYDDMSITYSCHFSIADPLGTRYIYDGGIDKTLGLNSYITSWHASSVVSANGLDSISFKYENEQNMNIQRHEDHIVVVDDYIPTFAMGYCGGVTNYGMIQANWLETNPDVEELFKMPVIYKTFDNVTKSYQLDSDHQLVDDGRSINKVEYNPNVGYVYQHLSEISYLGSKVSFLVDKDKCLSDILVKNSNNQQIKHFQLSYESHRDRHYLTQVKELATDGVVINSYQFSYNDMGGVARPGGRAYDFWGFNNSDYLADYISLVPTMKLYVSRAEAAGDIAIGYLDSLTIGGDPDRRIKGRHADEKYMRCGILSSIVHPTGAKECFEWEANKARLEYRINHDASSVFHITDELDGSNGIYVLGGLRIKEHKIEDNGVIKLRRTFVYGEKEDGAGVTPLRDGINYFMRAQTKIYDNASIRNQGGHSQSRYRTLSSSPIVPITYYNGASVMYDKVVEYTYQGDEPVRMTVYHYILPDLGGLDMLTKEDVWDFHVHNYANWFSDHLDSKKVYEKTGNGFKLVSSDSYAYSTRAYPKANYTVRGREYRNNFHENFSESDLNLIGPIAYGEYKDYQVTPKAKLLVSQSHTEYLSNGTKLSTLQTYGYGNPSDIRMTSQTMKRGGSKYTVHTSYPSNIDKGIYPEMVNKNMLDCPVEEWMERNGKVISARLMTYSSQGGCMLPHKIYTYTPGETGSPSTQFVGFDGENVNAIYTPLLELSYVKGRIGSLTDQQNIVTHYQWDGYRQYPIQEKKVGGEQEMVRSFSYLSGVGMTSETQPNGNVTSYVYNTGKRLSSVKDYNGKTLQKYRYKYISGRESHEVVTPTLPTGPTKIKLSYPEGAMPFSKSCRVSAVAFPATPETKILFSSTNMNVAKVTSDGVVTVVGGGVCEIVASTSDIHISASCRITANAKTGYYQITPIEDPNIKFME